MIALVHAPPADIQAGERTFVPRAAIDSRVIAEEHAAYCLLLAECGAQVRVLDVNRHLPDSVFIEDSAVVLDEVAILCSPGAASRRAELRGIEPVLREYRPVERVELPATVEGGDVLRVGRRLLVGQSVRTNFAGVAALAAIVTRFGYSVQAVPVRGALHLKTACCALPDGRLLVNPEWLDIAALREFSLVHVPEQERWGANVALVKNKVLLNSAHGQTAELIHALGFAVRTTDLSEFAKAEGGITCLGLFIA